MKLLIMQLKVICTLRYLYSAEHPQYKFYYVRTMHFGMKLYNDQTNAQVLNLFIYFCLTCFGLFFQPIFRGRCTNSAVAQISWVWYQRPGDLNHCRICIPASEDGL
jgi:hypothetical protein